MMTTFKHPVPTTTAHQHRIRLFQPTRRPIFLKDVNVETAWGTLKITGKIGQAHADVLEAIMFCAEKKGQMEDGRIKLLVDPYRVQKKARQSSRKQLTALLDELLAVVVHVNVSARQCKSKGHLIDHVTEATTSAGVAIKRANPLGGDRVLWRVEIGKVLTELINSDIWVGYDPQVIAGLRHGISQAVARHVLTHSHQPRGGWVMDSIINAVSGCLSADKFRDRRRELRSDVGTMNKLGIIIDGDRVRRVEQTPDIVEQTPGSVEQTPGSVEQTPGVWSKPPVSAGFSG